MKTLAERLRQARAVQGMSQQQLADAAQVSQGLISRMEAGEVAESRMMIRIADALSVDARWLAVGAARQRPGAKKSDSGAK